MNRDGHFYKSSNFSHSGCLCCIFTSTLTSQDLILFLFVFFFWSKVLAGFPSFLIFFTWHKILVSFSLSPSVIRTGRCADGDSLHHCLVFEFEKPLRPKPGVKYYEQKLGRQSPFSLQARSWNPGAGLASRMCVLAY